MTTTLPDSGPINLRMPGRAAPATPSTKLIPKMLRFHDVTDAEEYVDALADAVKAEAANDAGVAAEALDIAHVLYDPALTRGQAQVLHAERSRLCRMLNRRGDPSAILGVVVLLEDLAEQAPAVDAELAREDERRRSAEAVRPRLTTVLSKRGES